MILVRHSVVFALLLALAAAVIALPDPPEPYVDRNDLLHQQLAEAQSRQRLHAELLRRAHSRVVAQASLTALRPGNEMLSVVRPPEVPRAFADVLRGRVARDLSIMPRRDTTVEVRLVLTVDEDSTLAGVAVNRVGYYVSYDFFPPGSVADRVCFVVVRVHDLKRIQPNPKFPNRLKLSWNDPGSAGPCEWYAAFGVPGRGVATWLDSTNFSAIRNSRPSQRFNGSWMDGSYYESTAQAWSDALRGCGTDGHNCFASLTGTRMTGESPWQNAAYGYSIRTPNWIGRNRPWTALPNPVPGRMLVRMEHELGTESFEAMWKSDSALSVSFAHVRGGSLDVWSRDWLKESFGSHHAGPLRPWYFWVSVCGAFILFILLGLRAVSRRSGFA